MRTVQAVQDYRRSLARSERSRTRPDRPDVFRFHGRDWDLLPEVFAPGYSPSTGIAMEFLGLGGAGRRPPAGSFLEIGSGTGVIAITAAMAGAERVVATDVNPAAVRNTALNARRHGLAGRVRAVESDLCAGLAPGERFDTIFWSPPYVRAPEGLRNLSMHELAYVDPGYAAHQRFLAEVPARLAPGGVALLHFSTRGDVPELYRLAGELGHALRVRESGVFRDGGEDVEHLLLEVVPGAAQA